MAYSPNGSIGIKYFGSFLAIAGCQANIPSVLAYSANNIRSYSKRAINGPLVIGFGGIGGIMASTICSFYSPCEPLSASANATFPS